MAEVALVALVALRPALIILEMRETNPHHLLPRRDKERPLLPVSSRGLLLAPKERFTGHELDDETGLYYAGARYLDPVIGWWMSVEPLLNEMLPNELLTIRGGQLLETSPYNYTFNNPVNLTDPDGKCPDCVLDFIAIGLSAKDLIENPSWSNTGWLAADVVSAAIPIIPAPGGFRHGARILEAADHLMGAGRAAENVAQTFRTGDRYVSLLGEGAELGTDDALQKAGEFLGEGCTETSKGIFVSKDGARRVRMTDSDLSGHGGKTNPHLNFETGQTLKDRRGREVFEVDENKHIFYED